MSNVLHTLMISDIQQARKFTRANQKTLQLDVKYTVFRCRDVVRSHADSSKLLSEQRRRCMSLETEVLLLGGSKTQDRPTRQKLVSSLARCSQNRSQRLVVYSYKYISHLVESIRCVKHCIQMHIIYIRLICQVKIVVLSHLLWQMLCVNYIWAETRCQSEAGRTPPISHNKKALIHSGTLECTFVFKQTFNICVKSTLNIYKHEPCMNIEAN